jgi:hypothetical protein
MPLPDELLHAISSPGGGRVSLILGAGCSVEWPTNIPLASVLSREVHRRLVLNGILQEGDCENPGDLSLVADAVFAKRNSQRVVVEHMLSTFDLRLATPNEGYRIAAALLCERAISSIVTLNFDLALSTALADLGAGSIVRVIERPEDLNDQGLVNIYYLHRNAHSADAELWVLRTAALEVEWRDQWESIIATRVLTTPVVVFIGLGTPIAVLVESSRLILTALPAVTSIYQVDPGPRNESRFFQQSGLQPSHYIPLGWGAFMQALSERLVMEHRDQLAAASRLKVQEDGLHAEDITELLQQWTNLGLVVQGMLRAKWLLHSKPYEPVSQDAMSLIADLLLATVMIARISGSVPVITEDGGVEFRKNDRTVAGYMLVSGRGHRGTSAIEAQMKIKLRSYLGRFNPNGIIVGGTSDLRALPSPPDDIARGNASENSVIGSADLPIYHITQLRDAPDRISEVVP